MKNPLFDQIRDKHREYCPFEKLMTPVDSDDAFDYFRGESGIFKIQDYLKMIEFEVLSHQSVTSKQEKEKVDAKDLEW